MTYRTIFRKLSAVCEIRTGYTAKHRLEPLPDESEGGVRAIQLSDLAKESEIDLSTLPHYRLTGPIGRYWVNPGDILFRSRSQRNEAVSVNSKTDARAIAVLPLLILRPIPQVLDPQYLAWFINQPQAQRHFDRCARGTNMRMIPKHCLEELEIAIPDFETQKLIAGISALARHEYALALHLAEKKLNFTNLALLEQMQNPKIGHGSGQEGSRDPEG
jgi:hypothetical protein